MTRQAWHCRWQRCTGRRASWWGACQSWTWPPTLAEPGLKGSHYPAGVVFNAPDQITKRLTVQRRRIGQGRDVLSNGVRIVVVLELQLLVFASLGKLLCKWCSAFAPQCWIGRPDPCVCARVHLEIVRRVWRKLSTRCFPQRSGIRCCPIDENYAILSGATRTSLESLGALQLPVE